MEQPTQNPNVCDNCQPIKNYFLSELGMCGLCGGVGDCFDTELIAYYGKAGIEYSGLIDLDTLIVDNRAYN
ncbi:hypothetical protein TUM4438_41610 [Shewanella sairae]|uniref:Uncharacterized protein n=1 Tax=Shewanella sairae TaxID=190310 RepID=A0ABQ4PQP7_9GAMM|nr:hypothetical protein [Shewanella sairae]MCL1132353.1 hypothetical protein [Shewanella sairae]GIU51549.1 hypothetical protein TUM4438_41610 [Shewanella sairae]